MGIENQFENIYKDNYSDLCNTAFQIVYDEKAAEDIVQEVFLKIWNRKNEIQLHSSMKGYLIRSVINKSIDYLRTHKSLSVKRGVDLSLIRETENADRNINFRELQEIIYDAIGKLPPKCKAVFVLCRFEKMRYKEISEHMDISVKTVENQMNIALKKLQGELPQDLRQYNIETLLWVLTLCDFIN